MKIKSLVAAVSIAAASFCANATITGGVTVPNGSFERVELAQITIGTTSNISGDLGFLTNGTFSTIFGDINFNFSSVNFGESSFASQTATGKTFHFTNVAAGTYALRVSGTATPVANGPFGSSPYAVVAANYTVAAVPEPETYAMLLAGLGLMGGIARRRSSLKK